jgi:CHAD domain-containing protein
MLKKSKQRHYLAKQDREWQQELSAFGASHDEDAIHRLRVTIKKMKAFARFSNACSGRDVIKDVNLLKKMYRQAGTIRDAGNHLQLLEKVHPAPEFYREEQEQLKSAAAETFIGHIRYYRKQGKKARRRLLADLHAIRLDCIRDWYATQLIGISVLLTASGDRLHKARKQIKDLLYVLHLLPSRLVKELRLNRDYLDQLQEAIGRWHDTWVVAGAWAGKDLSGSQAMIKECREKEAAVRALAGQFYHRAHLDE